MRPLCLKKAFWFRVWQESAVPLQVAEVHDTLLVHANMVSVQVTRSSKRVRSLVKQARQQWMEVRSRKLLWRRKRAISNRSISSTKGPDLLSKLQCRSSCHLELLRPHRKGSPLCGDTILPKISIIVSEWFSLRLVFNVVTMLWTHKRHLLF